MKRIKYTILSFCLFGIFGIASCSKDEGPLIIIDPTVPIDSVKFGSQIQPIFDNHCTSCHNVTHNKLNLETCCSYDQIFLTGFSAPYVNTSNPTSSLLHTYLLGVPMLMPPMGAISDPEIELVRLWIEQGAVNN